MYNKIMRITKKRGTGEPVEKMISKRELEEIEKEKEEEIKGGGQ